MQHKKINENALLVLCRFKPQSAKEYSLAKIIYENDCFVHISLRTFFEEQGGRKYFALAQGLEWEGGDGIDDYC